jgi:hypothetical protein
MKLGNDVRDVCLMNDCTRPKWTKSHNSEGFIFARSRLNQVIEACMVHNILND